MDFGKFLFEQNKKAHAAKRKQKQIQIKEVKFRPGTEEGDYQVKVRNLIRFLQEGDKAKVTMRFRGREMAHQEVGRELLQRVQNDLAPYSPGRAEPADGRAADGDDVRAEEEVGPNTQVSFETIATSEQRRLQSTVGVVPPDRRARNEDVPQGLTSSRSCYAQVEDQPGSGEAFSPDCQRVQASPIPSSSHPHQEAEQA